MAITPILRGQKPNEKNRIPPQHNRSESYTSTHTAAPATISKENTSPHAAPSNDLIDFGQNSGAQTQPAQTYQAPADLQAAQTLNNGQQQKDLESTLLSTSSSRATDGGLIDFHDDLKKDLPAAQGKTVLKREDTETQSLDEFVDAEG